MSCKKGQLGNQNGIPDEATPDELLYRFFIRTQIEHALQQESEGKVIPHEEVEKMMAEWLGE